MSRMEICKTLEKHYMHNNCTINEDIHSALVPPSKWKKSEQISLHTYSLVKLLPEYLHGYLLKTKSKYII
jgi:hypothetical protein